MGLFDNLFLDQNTPVTINDGIDYSKDIVTPIISPEEEEDLHEADTTSIEMKQDNSIADLFESDKKEEKDAENTLNPDAPADVALEIGKTEDIPLDVSGGAIAPVDPAIGGVSFDIGGDLSFSNITESSVDTNQENPQGDTEVSPEPEIDIAHTEITEIPQTASTEATRENTGATPEIAGTFLGAEAGGPTPPETTATSETTPSTDISVGEAPKEGNIFDLIGGLGGATPETPPLAITPTVSSDVTVSTPTEIVPTPIIDSTSSLNASMSSDAVVPTLQSPLTSLGSTNSDMNLERDALALFSRGGQNSSLLRDKLTSFIEELKVLHSHDQSQRNHKLEQIAMYEERIREIDIEAAARKRVLHAEIEDLRRQIELMDTEKNDIQDVIASFHKELHVS